MKFFNIPLTISYFLISPNDVKNPHAISQIDGRTLVFKTITRFDELKCIFFENVC